MYGSVVYLNSHPAPGGLVRTQVYLRDNADFNQLTREVGSPVREFLGVDNIDAEGQAGEWLFERLS